MNPTASGSDTGLTMKDVPGPIYTEYCSGVHRVFLKRHNLQRWQLNIVGHDRREISVTSTAPDGLPTTTTIPLHLAFPDDLRSFLEEELKKYQKRENTITG